MSIPKKPKDVLLILSVLASKWDLWEDVEKDLERNFGEILYISSKIPFEETSYYDSELGTPIFRCIVAFEQLISPERLSDIKLTTNEIEKIYSTDDGRRIFNLDPGILSHERLVLATGKEYTHRIYLKNGIWADLTLIFQKGKWQSLPWTYPDYQREDVQEVLSLLRDMYKRKLRESLI